MLLLTKEALSYLMAKTELPTCHCNNVRRHARKLMVVIVLPIVRVISIGAI